jgi:hemerythrin-like domain-containing protein
MKATQQLKDEHEGIRTMLNILDKVCTKLEKEGALEREHFDGILEFLKIFVDKCHHAKEEEILFPAMIAASDEAIAPTVALRADHEAGRGYLASMSRAYTALMHGDSSTSGSVTENGRAYISLLRDHIAKENNVILEVADKKFSDAQQNELFEGFERIEEERIGHGKHEEFHGLLDTLSGIYL